MALAEGPDLDDEVSRTSSHLGKDDSAGATDPKTYQAWSIANVCWAHIGFERAQFLQSVCMLELLEGCTCTVPRKYNRFTKRPD
jgi:hypothetical protein